MMDPESSTSKPLLCEVPLEAELVAKAKRKREVTALSLQDDVGRSLTRRSPRNLTKTSATPIDGFPNSALAHTAKAVQTKDKGDVSFDEQPGAAQRKSSEVAKPKRSKKRSPPKTKSQKSMSSMAKAGPSSEDITFSGDDNRDDGPPPKKARKSRVPKPEPVYIIPDVERRDTSFKGRLGYACLNTILRNKKPASEAVFCSRTCRLDSLRKNGLEWVKDLGKKNMEDMLQIIQWNEDNHIKFMRLSSTAFPFASHPTHGYSLSADPSILALLARVGALANKYGHRITTHPGQYTQLGSPTASVVEASIKELVYHNEMLEGMGIGVDGVCIVHGGGVYGDKQSTLERIKVTIRDKLPQKVRNRLVLENDELCYTAEDLLPLCEELDVPLVFDYHHDSLNPSSIPLSAIIARANAIFTRRGIKPKQHWSESRPGAVSVMERRAHADRVEGLPDGLPDDMDLMIEAKDKEQAVLHLYRIYNLHQVDHASLRPPAANITMHTNGRKSNKKAKTKGVASAEAMEDLLEDEDS